MNDNHICCKCLEIKQTISTLILFSTVKLCKHLRELFPPICRMWGDPISMYRIFIRGSEMWLQYWEKLHNMYTYKNIVKAHNWFAFAEEKNQKRSKHFSSWFDILVFNFCMNIFCERRRGKQCSVIPCCTWELNDCWCVGGQSYVYSDGRRLISVNVRYIITC